MLDQLRQEDPELEVAQQPPHIEPALAPETNGEFAGRVGRVLESLGLSAEAVGAKYGTHASNFATAGLPAVVLGPGHIAEAHSAAEHLAVEDLERGVELYRQLMLQPATAWW